MVTTPTDTHAPITAHAVAAHPFHGQTSAGDTTYKRQRSFLKLRRHKHPTAICNARSAQPHQPACNF
jgi:hypothetical protein